MRCTVGVRRTYSSHWGSSPSQATVVHRPWSDSWAFFQQVAACAYEIPPDGTLDANLRWGVPASHRTQTPAGPQPTHDDRLLSAALIAHLDTLLRESKLLLGAARSKVLPTPDPLGRPVHWRPPLPTERQLPTFAGSARP